MISSRLTTARAAIGLFLAFLQVASATAATIEFTESGRNARSTLNFRGESNVLTTVPKGTEGDVLESYKLPSGNYGIKLRIKKVGAGHTSLKADQEIWVYYHAKNSPYIALLDDKGVSAKTPEDGTWAVVTKAFRTKKSAAKKEVVCKACHIRDAGQKQTNPVGEQQRKNLSDISDIFSNGDVQGVNAGENGKIPEEENKTPILDTSVEEMAVYIEKVEKKNLKKGAVNYMATRNHAVAEAITKECTKQGVPIELVMGIIKDESDFNARAGNGKGALGIMQLMHSNHRNLTSAGLKDIATNVHLGVTELKGYLTRYPDSLKKVLISYNFGEGALHNWENNKCKAKLRKNGVCQLPDETQKYLRNVPIYRDEYLAYERACKTSLGGSSFVVAENNPE